MKVTMLFTQSRTGDFEIQICTNTTDEEVNTSVLTSSYTMKEAIRELLHCNMTTTDKVVVEKLPSWMSLGGNTTYALHMNVDETYICKKSWDVYSGKKLCYINIHQTEELFDKMHEKSSWMQWA